MQPLQLVQIIVATISVAQLGEKRNVAENSNEGGENVYVFWYNYIIYDQENNMI